MRVRLASRTQCLPRKLTDKVSERRGASYLHWHTFAVPFSELKVQHRGVRGASLRGLDLRPNDDARNLHVEDNIYSKGQTYLSLGAVVRCCFH